MWSCSWCMNFFFFQAEDGIRDYKVTGVQTCALPISDYFARTVGVEPSADRVVFTDGEVFDDRAPQQRVPFAALAKMCHLERVSLGERGFYATKGLDWDADRGCGTPFLYFTMGCAVSEIEIDRFTGMMQTLRSDLLMDIGKSINPGIDRGQITGAFVQGMGWLTTEELRYAPNGELLSHSPTTYKIPNIQDLPETINDACIDNDTNTVNIRGSKAVGEPPLLLGISVFMAVKNALSYESHGAIPQLRAPATGEEILRLLTEYKAARVGAVAVAVG